MGDYDIEQHKKMIEIQLLNTKSEEEEIEKISEIVRNNLWEIFLETGVSMREFALLSGISPSTVKRVFNAKKGNLNLMSLLKLSANLGIPIECMVSELTPADIELVKKFHKLDGVGKENIKKKLEMEVVTRDRNERKVHLNERKYNI